MKAITQLPYGPVLLGVPQDLLQQAFIQSELLSTDLSNGDETPGIEVVESVTTAIRASKNPVILVDDYILRSGVSAETALAEFSDLIGAPVFQVRCRRGPMLFQQMRRERIRGFAGRYEPTCAQHFEMMHSADLLITIEDRNMYQE